MTSETIRYDRPASDELHPLVYQAPDRLGSLAHPIRMGFFQRLGLCGAPSRRGERLHPYRRGRSGRDLAHVATTPRPQSGPATTRFQFPRLGIRRLQYLAKPDQRDGSGDPDTLADRSRCARNDGIRDQPTYRRQRLRLTRRSKTDTQPLADPCLLDLDRLSRVLGSQPRPCESKAPWGK